MKLNRREVLKWSAPVLSTVVLPVHAQTSSTNLLTGFIVLGGASCGSAGMISYEPSIVPTPSPQANLDVTLSYTVTDGTNTLFTQSAVTTATSAGGLANFPANEFIDTATTVNLSISAIDPVTGNTVTSSETRDISSLTNTC